MAPAVRLIRYWAISLMSPPEKVLHGSGTGLRGMWSNYLDLRHVRQQNQELKEQVSRLQLEQAGLLEDARQGQRLQALLAFKEHYIYSTVPAQVIGTSGTDQSRILYIDKGAKDGLKPDMAVITPDGIVGKLKDVFAHTSQVLVISDQTSGAGVLLESTRLRGVLRGNALGQPQIINMLPDERVKPGERVITSGGDQIYPRGLPVGVVDQVVPDTSNPPYMDIVIKPAANLGHLEELLVITQASDQMPQTEKQDLAQSAAEGAAVSQQRASDILAERLPGLNDPNALADPGPEPDQTGFQPRLSALPPAASAPDLARRSLQLRMPTPPASALTPGQAVVDPKYAPQPKRRLRAPANAGRRKTAVAKNPEQEATRSGKDGAKGGYGSSREAKASRNQARVPADDGPTSGCPVHRPSRRPRRQPRRQPQPPEHRACARR